MADTSPEAEMPQHDVTLLLEAVEAGHAGASDQLLRLIYDELHVMAMRQMAGEGHALTLQATMLVSDVYLRLLGNNDVHWANRRHFFAAAAESMRRICIDDARRRGRLKRGSGQRPAPLDGHNVGFEDRSIDVLAVDEALKSLEQRDPRMAEIVKLRFFAGLSIDETAAALGVSPRLIDKEWAFIKAWLLRELGGETR